MTELTQDQIGKITRLANLDLSDREKEKYAQDLTEIIDYNMTLLNKVNVEGVEPTAHAGGFAAKLRSDETEPSLSQDEALRNTQKKLNGYFKVPAIMDID